MTHDDGKWWDDEELLLFGVADPDGATFEERSGLVRLIPVSEWVYHRWQVRFWDREPDDHQGGRGAVLLHERTCVETERHLESLISDHWPDSASAWFTSDRIAENVGPPPSLGRSRFGDGHLRYRGWERQP